MRVTAEAAFAAAEAAMSRPMVWGVADCCTAACDAFRVLWGVDPMTPLRGCYRSRRQAQRLILLHGGFLSLATDLALRAGLVGADGSLPGALGVSSDDGLMLGLGGGRWAMKGEDGLVIRRDCQKAWIWAAR